MIGKRVYPNEKGFLPQMVAGEYGKGNANHPDWRSWWMGVAPDGSSVMLNPSVHAVQEHPDGTITVSPSIVTKTWHGWLRNGDWTSV